ncbi:MAG: hypothetical protein GXY77_09820 [Fibrobacter sp.]|nr:hypothetical protein [Fibrobacter sp.]
MSVFRLIVAASLIFSAVAFGAEEVDLNAPAVLEDFDDAYGDEPDQTTVGAVYGIVTGGAVYKGKGFWYFFKDPDGSDVTDFEGEQVTNSTVPVLNQEGVLIANLYTSGSDNKNPYAGVGCNLVGDDKSNETPIDLSQMTALSVRIKGEGTVRLLFKTMDLKTAEWGYYGYDIVLPVDWETITIDAEDILPEEWSDPYKDDWTFAHGADEVLKLEFKVKDGDDASIQVDEIVAEGMTYADFGWDTRISYSHSSKASTKNLSVKGSNISFNLAQPQNLTLSLSDIMGNRISTLFTGNAASKSVNLSNMRIPNGRYIVVLSGQNTKMVQPVAIMK